jgi:two-component system phosphate regulon response regulator PhoB
MTGEGVHILIVDNDERIVELVAWFLERHGYSVRSADSFDGARVAIRERRPDLMLSDVDLGMQNACEELPRLDQEGLLPPTLVVSGFLTADMRVELLALEPVLDTLAKPFEFEELERRMVACLARAEGTSSLPPIPSAQPSENPGDSGLRAGESEDEEGWIEVGPTVTRGSGEVGSE